MQGALISRSAAIQALQKAKELASEPPTRFDIYIHKTFDLCIHGQKQMDMMSMLEGMT